MSATNPGLNFLNQYVASKVPVHRSDKNRMLLPNVDHSEAQYPHFPARPAHYLPVQYFDVNFQDWLVILSGKVVALDSNGHLVPANITHANSTLAYTQEDVRAKTILPDGVTICNSTHIGTTVKTLMDAASITSSKAVGYAPYSYWRWSGNPSTPAGVLNPIEMRELNWNLQHQTSICTKYIVEIPVITVQKQETVIKAGSRQFRLPGRPDMSAGKAPTFAGGNAAQAFVNLKALPGQIENDGDYYLEWVTGTLTWVTELTDNVTVTWYPEFDGDGSEFVHYINYTGDWTTPTGVSDVIPVAGNYVMAREDGSGNYTVWDGKDYTDVIGQIIYVDTSWPRNDLALVQGVPQMLDYVYDAVPSDETQGHQHLMWLTNALSTRVFINILR